MREYVRGVLKRTSKGAGVLRDPERSFKRGGDEVSVPSRLIQKYRLVEGVFLEGPTRRAGRRWELRDVKTVCDMPPEDYRKRTPFKDLVAVNPTERFRLALSGDDSMRVVDLIAPIGKGTRGLIVSPPKAGKTYLFNAVAVQEALAVMAAKRTAHAGTGREVSHE